MAKNFIQEGDFVDVIAPSGGVASGDFVVIGKLFGVAATSAAEGESVALAVEGVFELPLASVTAGTLAYVGADGALTASASHGSPAVANPVAGVAVADSVAGVTRVRLNGAFVG